MSANANSNTTHKRKADTQVDSTTHPCKRLRALKDIRAEREAEDIRIEKEKIDKDYAAMCIKLIEEQKQRDPRDPKGALRICIDSYHTKAVEQIQTGLENLGYTVRYRDEQVHNPYLAKTSTFRELRAYDATVGDVIESPK
jgi:hypothetical protein